MLSDTAIEEQIPRLRRYARALTGSRDTADDLVQDTLERALGRSALFRPGGNARAWLFSIMHNLFVNQVRSVAQRSSVPYKDDIHQPATQDSAPEGLAVRDIERALGLLPNDQREVVLLIALEELSYSEAAKVIGAPIGTVMSRLSRGRERLRALINGTDVAPLKVIK